MTVAPSKVASGLGLQLCAEMHGMRSAWYMCRMTAAAVADAAAVATTPMGAAAPPYGSWCSPVMAQAVHCCSAIMTIECGGGCRSAPHRRTNTRLQCTTPLWAACALRLPHQPYCAGSLLSSCHVLSLYMHTHHISKPAIIVHVQCTMQLATSMRMRC